MIEATRSQMTIKLGIDALISNILVWIFLYWSYRYGDRRSVNCHKLCNIAVGRDQSMTNLGIAFMSCTIQACSNHRAGQRLMFDCYRSAISSQRPIAGTSHHLTSMSGICTFYSFIHSLIYSMAVAGLRIARVLVFWLY